MATATADPVEATADPDKLREMLAAAVVRSRMLRGLLKLAEQRRVYEPNTKTNTQTTTPSATRDAAR